MLFSSSLVSFALLFSSSASLVLGAIPIPTSGCKKMGDSCVLLLGDETRGVCNSTLKCIPHCGTAGMRRCSSTITQLCEATGFWKSELDCSKTATASTCDPTAAFGCRYCTEGAMQCTNSSAFSGVSGISKCNLGSWETTSCSAGSSCDQNLLNAGFGYCRVCTEGAKQCSSDLMSVQTCTNGAWSTTSCGSYQCMSMQSSVTCRVCTEGTKQCSSDSKSLQTCTNGAWSTTATCGYCDAASTQCGSCKPGTLQCPYKGAYLLQCNNQLQWYQTQSRC